MKNTFCKLDEEELQKLDIPEMAEGLLTSPFQNNIKNGWVMVPIETFQQFTDVVTEYVLIKNLLKSQ